MIDNTGLSILISPFMNTLTYDFHISVSEVSSSFMDISTSVGGLLGCVVLGFLFRIGWLWCDWLLDAIRSLFCRHD